MANDTTDIPLGASQRSILSDSPGASIQTRAGIRSEVGSEPSLLFRIGRVIRFFRLVAGLKQSDIVDRVNLIENRVILTQPKLSDIEAGKRDSIESLRSIAATLEMPLWKLIQNAEEVSADPAHTIEVTKKYFSGDAIDTYEREEAVDQEYLDD